mmetsp:Transcript_5989/g.21095  ORF Transcript_5989/g.21095 Transcript_5989/m.21095 type:complete len:236 (-) Transcript_5989:636-1343(-)
MRMWRACRGGDGESAEHPVGNTEMSRVPVETRVHPPQARHHHPSPRGLELLRSRPPSLRKFFARRTDSDGRKVRLQTCLQPDESSDERQAVGDREVELPRRCQVGVRKRSRARNFIGANDVGYQREKAGVTLARVIEQSSRRRRHEGYWNPSTFKMPDQRLCEWNRLQLLHVDFQEVEEAISFKTPSSPLAQHGEALREVPSAHSQVVIVCGTFDLRHAPPPHLPCRYSALGTRP